LSILLSSETYRGLFKNGSFLAKFSSLQNLKVVIYKGGVATADFSKIETQKKALYVPLKGTPERVILIWGQASRRQFYEKLEKVTEFLR